MHKDILHTTVQQESHATRCQDTLLHWKALLVATTHNLEDVPFEFLNKLGSSHVRIDLIRKK